MSNHVLIRLIRFVSRLTTHLCIAIYFLTIFSTSYKRFTKILHFAFWNLNKALLKLHPGCKIARHRRFIAPRKKTGDASSKCYYYNDVLNQTTCHTRWTLQYRKQWEYEIRINQESDLLQHRTKVTVTKSCWGMSRIPSGCMVFCKDTLQMKFNLWICIQYLF